MVCAPASDTSVTTGCCSTMAGGTAARDGSPRGIGTGGAGLFVGATPRYRLADEALGLKLGAATTPPLLPFAWGASIITMIASAGLRDGTKPTNETLFSFAE